MFWQDMQKNTMFQAIFQNFSAHFLLYFCHRSSGLKKVFLHKLLSSSPTHEARRHSKSRESAGFAGVPTGVRPGDESEDTLGKAGRFPWFAVFDQAQKLVKMAPTSPSPSTSTTTSKTTPYPKGLGLDSPKVLLCLLVVVCNCCLLACCCCCCCCCCSCCCCWFVAAVAAAAFGGASGRAPCNWISASGAGAIKWCCCCCCCCCFWWCLWPCCWQY